jgi:predicted nucleic acid-binding protein
VSQRFVVDASICLAVALAEAGSANASAAIIQRLSNERALVPGLWSSEIANGLMVQERRGRIRPEQSDQFLAWLANVTVDVDLDGLSRTAADVLALARRHRLTIYDALYLELARRTQVPLATLDSSLAAAAERESVALLVPRS